MESLKLCTKCKILKPLEDFWKAKGTKDGVFCWCKDCGRSHGRKYFEGKKDIINKKSRGRRKENIIQSSEKEREYKENNKKEINGRERILSKKRREKDPEKSRKTTKNIRTRYGMLLNRDLQIRCEAE